MLSYLLRRLGPALLIATVLSCLPGRLAADLVWSPQTGWRTSERIFFTSGGTESDNHAVKGVAMANADKGKHIVTTNIEHNAVIRSLRRLKADGFTVTSLSVDDKGRVNPQDVAEAVTKDTILISVMHSNNETGTIQPVEEIAKIAREKKIIFHIDAVDSVGIVPDSVRGPAPVSIARILDSTTFELPVKWTILMTMLLPPSGTPRTASPAGPARGTRAPPGAG